MEKVAQLDRQQLVAADAEGADPAAAGGAAEPGPQQQQQQGEEQQEVPEEVAALARLHKDVHRHLAMQVEGVCKLVSRREWGLLLSGRGMLCARSGVFRLGLLGLHHGSDRFASQLCATHPRCTPHSASTHVDQLAWHL